MQMAMHAHSYSPTNRRKGPVKITVPEPCVGEHIGVLQDVANLGLLGRVWPQQRLLVGMSVCKWMNRELIALVHEVELFPSGPVRPSQIKNTFLRFRKHRIIIRWTEQSPPSSPLDRKIADVRLENFLKALSTTLKMWEETKIPGNDEEAVKLQIVHLQIQSNGLGRKSAAMLSEVLATSNSLQELDLSGPGNRIGAVGATLVAGVSTCSSLTRLILHDNEIGGASKLLGLIGEFRELRELDLSDNDGIGAKGARQLSAVIGGCRKLWALQMRNTGILEEGAEHLGGALAACRELERVDLGDNQIGAGGAAGLAGMLRGCRRLGRLSLRGNRIGSKGVEALEEGLRESAALAHLDLSANSLGDAGAQRLAGVLRGCGALRVLKLGENLIANAGAGALAEMVGECRALAHLDLSANGIGEEGALRLLRWLGNYPSLQGLDLRGNWLGPPELERLRRGLGAADAALVQLQGPAFVQ